MSCESYNGGTLHICRGPAMEEVRRRPDREAWCFICRKRRQFERVVTAPVMPKKPTKHNLPWYGPSTHIECGTCKTWDGDCFPGSGRDWG